MSTFFISVSDADDHTGGRLNYRVYFIEPTNNFQPSGLTIKNNRLFTVSDKHDAIYELLIDEQVAYMKLHHKIDVQQLGVMSLDLEGITHNARDFFLVSEAHHRMIRVEPSGNSYWIPSDGKSFYRSANQAGLFQVFNAALEGITWLEIEGQFLLAAERQPRGLIEIAVDEQFRMISQTNHVLNQTIYDLPKNRQPDLTGLFYYQGSIFALHRNAELIHRWVKDDSGRYQEQDSWSFTDIVNQPDFRYQDKRYGHAEGLAVDEDHFYLVIDNNGIAKEQQDNDNRPMLIIIDRKNL